MTTTIPFRGLLPLAAALLLAGCASLSPDGGAGRVAELTKERTGQSVAFQRSSADIDSAAARVAELLKQPLTSDSAVEVALLNHRGLQARFAELGVVEADVVRAGRASNPRLGLSRLAGGGVTELHRSLVFDVLNLLTLLTQPMAGEAARLQFEQAQLQAAGDAVAAAAEARSAFFGAVAARELTGYFEQVKDAADASNELARRMQRAGHFSQLTQMREQAFQADAAAGLARARHREVAERERLARALGLSGTQLAALTLPERLPDLPNAPIDAKDAEQTAIDRRLDVLAARRATDAAAKSLGLTQATRFVNVLDVGFTSQSETDAPRKRGVEIELELPLFDFGGARSARAEAVYRQALHHTADVAVNARSQVRESYSAYRTAYELARHYRDEVVPLRKRIADEHLLRYNGMLTSVFELLADAREQVGSVSAAVEALRDHWLAETALQSALSGGAAINNNNKEAQR